MCAHLQLAGKADGRARRAAVLDGQDERRVHRGLDDGFQPALAGDKFLFRFSAAGGSTSCRCICERAGLLGCNHQALGMGPLNPLRPQLGLSPLITDRSDGDAPDDDRVQYAIE